MKDLEAQLRRELNDRAQSFAVNPSNLPQRPRRSEGGGSSRRHSWGAIVGVAAVIVTVPAVTVAARQISRGPTIDRSSSMSASPSPGERLGLRTHSANDPSLLALTGGVLSVDRSVANGCIFLQVRSGNKVELIWPSNFVIVREDPLQVADGSGNLVAEEGKFLRAGGGLAAHTVGCVSGGQAFLVGAVLAEK